MQHYNNYTTTSAVFKTDALQMNLRTLLKIYKSKQYLSVVQLLSTRLYMEGEYEFDKYQVRV